MSDYLGIGVASWLRFNNTMTSGAEGTARVVLLANFEGFVHTFTFRLHSEVQVSFSFVVSYCHGLEEEGEMRLTSLAVRPRSINSVQ